MDPVAAALVEVADELDEIAGAVEALAASCEDPPEWLLERLGDVVEALHIAAGVLHDSSHTP